eukprot:gb/GECG01012655.1/.p1 GENE.gb/GECG01012655.1/~~gb/GECG01012655.1/.p1  ORF type:complete len:189 (+),score=11.32 gb/GECG01012655.1/:1-567(+)
MPKRVTKLRKRIFIELRLSVDAKIYLLLVIIIHCIGLNNHNWYYQSSAKYSSAGFSGGKTTAKGKFSCHHSRIPGTAAGIPRYPAALALSESPRELIQAHVALHHSCSCLLASLRTSMLQLVENTYFSWILPNSGCTYQEEIRSLSECKKPATILETRVHASDEWEEEASLRCDRRVATCEREALPLK